MAVIVMVNSIAFPSSSIYLRQVNGAIVQNYPSHFTTLMYPEDNVKPFRLFSHRKLNEMFSDRRVTPITGNNPKPGPLLCDLCIFVWITF